MKKLLLASLLTIVICCCSCGKSESSSATSETNKSNVTQSEVSSTTAEKTERNYHIIQSPGDPNEDDLNWDITDTAKLDKIDQWVEQVKSICNDYVVENPKATGGSTGYILKTDGDNENGIYFITTDSASDVNYSYNQTEYKIPQEYIDQIVQLIK